MQYNTAYDISKHDIHDPLFDTAVASKIEDKVDEMRKQGNYYIAHPMKGMITDRRRARHLA
jgi:hypothetical protein